MHKYTPTKPALPVMLNSTKNEAENYWINLGCHLKSKLESINLFIFILFNNYDSLTTTL